MSSQNEIKTNAATYGGRVLMAVLAAIAMASAIVFVILPVPEGMIDLKDILLFRAINCVTLSTGLSAFLMFVDSQVTRLINR